MGIDPGTRVAGYGIIDFWGHRQKAVAVGAWKLAAQEKLPHRLHELQEGVRDVITRFQPELICLELAFVAANVRSALFLGHARGVVMAESCAHGIPVHEVSATQAKKILTDYGRADKSAVARTLSRLLHVDLSSCLPDASDALCLAYAAAVMAAQQGGVTGLVSLPKATKSPKTFADFKI